MEEIEGFDQYENYLDSLVGEEDTKSVNLSSNICKIVFNVQDKDKRYP